MHNFKSHFWWDFLPYCTRPANVHLVMAFTGCSFNSFSIFLLSLKQQQKLMKIMFFCIHFPVWPYPPKIMKNLYFIPVNCMGWQVCNSAKFETLKTFLFAVLHWHVKRFSSKRIALKEDVSQDQKMYRLKAPPCIFQPRNFTVCGSEGVNFIEQESKAATV